MGSIDQQIDAAVVLMKARAAEFDDRPDWIPMDEWVAQRGPQWCINNLVNRAYDNLAGCLMRESTRTDLLDTMNLCALALSLHPDRNPGQGGEG